MIRLNLLTYCLIIVFANCNVECSVGLFNSNISVLHNLAQFLNENPKIQMNPFMREETYDERSQTFRIIHKFGERIDGK